MYEGDPSVAMMAGRYMQHPTPPQPIRPQVSQITLRQMLWKILLVPLFYIYIYMYIVCTSNYEYGMALFLLGLFV